MKKSLFLAAAILIASLAACSTVQQSPFTTPTVFHVKEIEIDAISKGSLTESQMARIEDLKQAIMKKDLHKDKDALKTDVEATMADLRELADEIRVMYRNHGFTGTKVVVPAQGQFKNWILRIDITEGVKEKSSTNARKKSLA